MIWIMIFIGAIIADIVCYKILSKKINTFFDNLKLTYVLLGVFYVLTYILLGFLDLSFIIIHVTLIWLLCDIKRIKSDIYINGILALVISVVYLTYGYVSCNSIVNTTYELKSDKLVNDYKIAYFSDSHIGTTFNGDYLKNIVDNFNKQNLDMIFIVGDFVDDNTTKEDMIKATSHLSKLNTKYGVYYVFGNHDKGYFNKRDFTGDELVDELEKNKVTVLQDELVRINSDLCILGRQDKLQENLKVGRKSIEELNNMIVKDCYTIVLDHQPHDSVEAKKNNIDLVLSGHTHGGQVFPFNTISKLIGENDYTYGHHIDGNTNYIISSGMSDWELNFKTGTKSEYVTINLLKK